MKLYIIRHGQTDYNLKGKFQGQINIPLNVNGIEQVNKTKEELEDIEFDIVISSPLKRALQTAQIITDKPINIDKRIIERSFGELEGKYGIPDYEEKQDIYKIEKLQQLCERVYPFLEEIMVKYKDKNNILIVTHEAISQLIDLYFNKDKKQEEWKEFRLKTAGCKIYNI